MDFKILILTIFIYTFCSLLLVFFCSRKKLDAGKTFIIELTILSLSIYLHLFLAILTPYGDSVYFTSVLNHLVDGEFFGFYDRMGITYPPLFNYLFYLLANLLRLLGLPFDWRLRPFIFAIKLPGILCEFLMTALIFRSINKKFCSSQRPTVLFLILLNPGYLLVTSYICQVDALYSLFVLLTVWCIVNKKLKTGYFCFAAGILFKFQTLFVAPILIFAIIDQVILHDFSWKRFFSHLFTGLTAISCMILCYLPFIYDFKSGSSGEHSLTYNFTSSVTGYGRSSTNAYNFWTLLGFNLKYDSNSFGPFSCSTWGTIFIICIVVFACILFVKNSFDSDIYPLLAAFLVSGIFCFSVRMMARYLYPAIVLLIFAYALKPSLKRFFCTLLFSLAFFLNVWCDYLVYPYTAYHKGLVLPYVISAFMLLCFFLLSYTLVTEISGKSQKKAAVF